MSMFSKTRRRLRKGVALLLCLSVLAPIAGPALAWKPKTHVYLADEAMRDATDNGMVTLYQTEYATGRVIGSLGEFEANPAIVAALRAAPAQYRAGVVGPDAYPDLMTGQQVIHPGTNLNLLGSPQHNEPASQPGTDAWLTHLWRLAYGRKDPNVERVRDALNRGPLGEVAPATDTPQIRAFVAGYLTHAAGDMFMHTFVNHYTGGDFAIQPEPRNALKHIVLEGYVGKRTPDTHSETSIEGLEDFIYRYMVRAYPGSLLEERLLQGAGTATSVPSIFSTLRNGLQRDVDRYDRERLELRGPARVAYSTAHGPKAEYKRAWIADIDRGLRAWPRTAHEISLALVYNPHSDGADIGRAKEVASAYVNDHVLSMAGLPDALIATAQFISSVIQGILPTFLQEALAALKRRLLEWLVEEATGMTVDEIAAYLNHPETQFDPVMNSPGGGYGGRTETLVTLAEFNRSVLGIDDPGAQFMDRKFQIERFAPAFNTIQMTKLLFLSEKGMRDLLAALRAKGLTVPDLPTTPGGYESAMLGFLTSMDGDNRWQGLAHGSTQPQGQAFFLARGNADAWRNLFMRQIGERQDWPAASAPDQDALAPRDDTGFVPIDWWAVRMDDVKYDGDAGRNVAVTLTFRNDGARARSFSNRIVEPVRALLNVGNGRASPLRMEYVHTDDANMPQWHFPPTSEIPPKGRITVRFIFDVGDGVRQRLVDSISIFERRPGRVNPLQQTDGPTKDIDLPGLNLDGTVGAPPPPPPPAAVDPAELKKFEGRYETTRGTILPLRVEGDALVGEAMTVQRPSPSELVRLTLQPDGSLSGTMRVPYNSTTYAYYLVSMRFDADLAAFTGQLRTGAGSTEPPLVYSGRRLADGATSADSDFSEPGPPARIGPYDVSFVSLQKGDDGDWESTWSLTNRSEATTQVPLNDISATLRGEGGETSTGGGPYHYAGETGRRVRSSGFEIAPGEETRIRLWHSRSGPMTPVGYIFRVGAIEGEGEFGGAFAAKVADLEGGFQRTAYLDMKVDRVTRTSGGGVEVTLTAKHDGDARRGIQHDPQRYSVMGSDGVEYAWDGNYYGASSRERPSHTVFLARSEGTVTYVFPRVPAGVSPVRLILRQDGRETASFDLSD